ncbi:hypothetical protein MKY98_00490 [Paenibacillus sp. FSL M8-0228]|uniref:hypothetical protein n=1 Tax=Paenibacillus TaxID=44249 RepID=UPI00083E2DDC|nr:hypothetical protein [Paenibacillus polymyxa]MBO3284658.1 hypothetical protein [Paenibacillus polymyxa]ODB55458.1 hypothetical protein A7311_19620 [Paenibacillus polymyxa]
MSKKLSVLVLTMVLLLTVALVGCSKKLEPKEAVTTGTANAMKLNSYESKSQFTVKDLTISSATLPSEQSAMITSMLKNADITLDGVYQKEPFQSEMTLGIHLKGDLSTSFTIPMVMTKDKLYVKIPNIPFYPLPQDVVGKFLIIDPQELAKQSGQEFNPAAMDQEKSQKFANEVIAAIMNEYDQATYFFDIDPKDAKLPQGVEAKQVVQFKITNDNVKKAVDTFVTKAVPKAIDIMSKDEYISLFQLKKEDLTAAKLAVETNTSDFRKKLDELKNYLTVKQFDINTALNKDNIPVYQDLNANVEMNDPATKDNVKLSVTGYTQYNKINAKAAFKVGIPTADQVLTMEQLQQKMQTVAP